jgi:broad specificity phosphatase PhoE
VEVYLVRHAEDRARAGEWYGDGGLSERGRDQARELGRALAEVPFRICHCSTLERARETAEIALRGRDVPVRLHPDLAEGSVGSLEGLSFAEARSRFPEDFRLGRTVVARLAACGRTATGGETRAEFLERVDRALELVRSEVRTEGGGPALVVSHGGLLNYLIQRLLEMPVRDEVPFGFDHCGGLRVLSYREDPGFGPFPMVRVFGIGA